MMARCKTELDNKRISSVNEGVKINKLLQIASGCIYDEDKVPHYLNIDNKLQLLYEAVEQSHRKLIVFAPYVHVVNMLHERLKKKEWSVDVVYGKIPKRRRVEIFQRFQSGDLEILLAHPKTMAHGLNLTRAHTICWWAPPLGEDYEIFNQANGRITRPGQKSKQTIIELICSPVEKEIYKKLDNKEKMQGLLTELLTTKV
jgi:SNF2 family DNA or RNA helicase